MVNPRRQRAMIYPMIAFIEIKVIMWALFNVSTNTRIIHTTNVIMFEIPDNNENLQMET